MVVGMAQPCDSCWKARKSCNGWPSTSCSRCSRLGIECSFPTKKKRGPARGSRSVVHERIRKLEALALRLGLDPKDPEALERAAQNVVQIAQEENTQAFCQAPVPVDSWMVDLSLLDTYSRVIQPHFHITDISKLFDEDLEVASRSPDLNFLLCTIYALAISISESNCNDQTRCSADSWFALAKRMLPDVTNNPSLWAAQALANMCLFSTQRWPAEDTDLVAADMYLSMAVTMMRLKGVDQHLEKGSECCETWWALYKLDNIMAVLVNRTHTLCFEDAVSVPPQFNIQSLKYHVMLEKSHVFRLGMSTTLYLGLESSLEADHVSVETVIIWAMAASLTDIEPFRWKEMVLSCVRAALNGAESDGFVDLGDPLCNHILARLTLSLVEAGQITSEELFTVVSALVGNGARWKASNALARDILSWWIQSAAGQLSGDVLQIF